MKQKLGLDLIDKTIDIAFAEDVGKGDITSIAVIPAGERFTGVLAAREEMVIAGMDFAMRCFERLSPDAKLDPRVRDGDKIAPGTVIAVIEGPGREMLTAERTALNMLQHLSGIATETRKYVDRIEGTGATLLDTRKTIPGLRLMAKYASNMGGATNHRIGLYDAVLIKDNHIAVCGSITRAVELCKADNLSPIQVECDTFEQVQEAVTAGADKLLLDNMDNDTLRQCVAWIGDKAITEASGGVRLDTIRGIAETGVQYISVGRITQSAAAVDIGLDWQTA